MSRSFEFMGVDICVHLVSLGHIKKTDLNFSFVFVGTLTKHLIFLLSLSTPCKCPILNYVSFSYWGRACHTNCPSSTYNKRANCGLVSSLAHTVSKFAGSIWIDVSLVQLLLLTKPTEVGMGYNRVRYVPWCKNVTMTTYVPIHHSWPCH
jgi:hypothetical protein